MFSPSWMVFPVLSTWDYTASESRWIVISSVTLPPLPPQAECFPTLDHLAPCSTLKGKVCPLTKSRTSKDLPLLQGVYRPDNMVAPQINDCRIIEKNFTVILGNGKTIVCSQNSGNKKQYLPKKTNKPKNGFSPLLWYQIRMVMEVEKERKRVAKTIYNVAIF